MVWLSTKKEGTTVKILNFCSKFSELCLELFPFRFGNHSGNQLKFRLYPVIPGELWVCPSILFAPRQRSIVTHLISKFEENRRGVWEIIGAVVLPFKSNGRQIRPSVTTHSNGRQNFDQTRHISDPLRVILSQKLN